jgi:RNA polymerase sigma-70 factor (ECF subfamily)
MPLAMATMTSTPLITAQAVRELSPSLLAFAYRRVGQRQEAEDLVQDTWFSALRSAPTFEGRSSLQTWLVTILRRRIAERYRRRHASERFEEDDFEVELECRSERLDLALAASVALAALSSLTEQERQAVTLCDVDDLERDVASASLGVTRGHLRVLLHRGRHKLVSSLQAAQIEV